MKRFWDKIKKTERCWEWQGWLLPNGYGQFRFNGKYRKAHRASWEIHFGEIPAGLCVCHKCDNRKCVRPEHLFLGTHKDNARDRGEKGRHAHGESQWKTKLTENQARDIFKRISDGETRMAVAKSLNINRMTVYRILKGKSWRHLGISKR